MAAALWMAVFVKVVVTVGWLGWPVEGEKEGEKKVEV